MMSLLVKTKCEIGPAQVKFKLHKLGIRIRQSTTCNKKIVAGLNNK